MATANLTKLMAELERVRNNAIYTASRLTDISADLLNLRRELEQATACDPAKLGEDECEACT